MRKVPFIIICFNMEQQPVGAIMINDTLDEAAQKCDLCLASNPAASSAYLWPLDPDTFARWTPKAVYSAKLPWAE